MTFSAGHQYHHCKGFSSNVMVKDVICKVVANVMCINTSHMQTAQGILSFLQKSLPKLHLAMFCQVVIKIWPKMFGKVIDKINGTVRFLDLKNISGHQIVILKCFSSKVMVEDIFFLKWWTK